ncbi:MAG TPA: hypothetical protein VMU84_18090 [Thermoanaerobaculia bacterium]|nr:hypothetical protein [Thermoanaerobaculia bacterium]
MTLLLAVTGAIVLLVALRQLGTVWLRPPARVASGEDIWTKLAVIDGDREEVPNDLPAILARRTARTRELVQQRRGFAIVHELLLPLLNIIATASFAAIALLTGRAPLLVIGCLVLIAIDALIALRTNASLVFYAIFHRLFYVLVLDVCRVFATIEELGQPACISIGSTSSPR